MKQTSNLRQEIAEDVITQMCKEGNNLYIQLVMEKVNKRLKEKSLKEYSESSIRRRLAALRIELVTTEAGLYKYTQLNYDLPTPKAKQLNADVTFYCTIEPPDFAPQIADTLNGNLFKNSFRAFAIDGLIICLYSSKEEEKDIEIPAFAHRPKAPSSTAIMNEINNFIRYRYR